jgi:hypothetical protein
LISTRVGRIISLVEIVGWLIDMDHIQLLKPGI